MERQQKIEEALTIIWQEKERQNYQRRDLAKKVFEKLKEDILEELINEGYLLRDKENIEFSSQGEVIARDIIRRQRLAERLFMDVLEIARTQSDSYACDFEHIISKEVEEAICTLLGHPRECPHGHPIPLGDCCRKAKSIIGSIVVPLNKVSVGEKAKVVYLLTQRHPQLHKLMSLGIVPGVTISLHQVSPSFIIQVEETQIALEEEIAKEIYVKRI